MSQGNSAGRDPFRSEDIKDKEAPVVDATTKRMLGNAKGRQKTKGRASVAGKETRKNVDMSPAMAAFLDEISSMTSASVSDIVAFLIAEGACCATINSLRDRLMPYQKQLRYENYLPTVNVSACRRVFLGLEDKNGQPVENGAKTAKSTVSAR